MTTLGRKCLIRLVSTPWATVIFVSLYLDFIEKNSKFYMVFVIVQWHSIKGAPRALQVRMALLVNITTTLRIY